MRAIQLICVVTAAGLMVCGCGGSSHKAGSHTVSFQHSRLPARARPLFASDQPAAVGHVLSATTSGRTVASLGFDLTRDGFSFENYGFIAGSGEVDQHVLRELFGDGVCASAPSDSCTLIPAASQWAEQAAQDALGGHCFGFSVTALRFFTHRLDPTPFGGPNAYSLALSSPLESELAYGWVMQELSSVQNGILSGPPSAIITDLEHAFANPSAEVYTLAFRNGTGPNSEGHAVTPFGIESLGGGRYDILIYDNNKPDSTQAVSVDVKAQTWSYNLSTNPNNPTTLWSGQGDNNPMLLYPLFPGLGVQPCPFCQRATGHSGFVEITLGGDPDSHGHLLIDANGRKLGVVGGRFINQIKGARIILPLLNEVWQAHPEPIYEVPVGTPLRITLPGAGRHAPVPESVHVVGPAFGATVANLGLGPAARAQIQLGAAGDSISLRAFGASQSVPVVQLATNEGRGGVSLALTPSSFAPGEAIAASVAPSGVSVTSSVRQTASVAVTTVGTRGARTRQANVSLSPSRALVVHLPSAP